MRQRYRRCFKVGGARTGARVLLTLALSATLANAQKKDIPTPPPSADAVRPFLGTWYAAPKETRQCAYDDDCWNELEIDRVIVRQKGSAITVEHKGDSWGLQYGSDHETYRNVKFENEALHYSYKISDRHIGKFSVEVVVQLDSPQDLRVHKRSVGTDREGTPAKQEGDETYSSDPSLVKEAMVRRGAKTGLLGVLSDLAGSTAQELAKMPLPIGGQGSGTAGTPSSGGGSTSSAQTQNSGNQRGANAKQQPQKQANPGSQTAGGTVPQQQGQQLPTSQQSGAGGGNLASSGTPAPNCVNVQRNSDGVGGWGIANRCNYAIEVQFCVQNPKSSLSCQTDGGETGVKANGFEFALPFYEDEGRGQVYFAACVYPGVPVNWQRNTTTPYTCRN